MKASVKAFCTSQHTETSLSSAKNYREADFRCTNWKKGCKFRVGANHSKKGWRISAKTLNLTHTCQSQGRHVFVGL